RGVRRDDACGTARLTPAADSPHSFRRHGSQPTHMSLELLRDRLLTALLEPGENGIAPAVPLVVRDGDAILLLRSAGLLLRAVSPALEPAPKPAAGTGPQDGAFSLLKRIRALMKEHDGDFAAVVIGDSPQIRQGLKALSPSFSFGAPRRQSF